MIAFFRFVTIVHYAAMGLCFSAAEEDNNGTETQLSEQLEANQQQNEEHVMYFGYGSNLLMQNFEKFKNLKVVSYSAGIVPGYSLSFSFSFPAFSFANIHSSPDDAVHGVIMTLKRPDFDKLVALEYGYRLITVDAFSYKNRTDDAIQVQTLIFDEEQERWYKEQNPESKMMPIFGKSGDIKPERNYLDMIIYGAQQLELDEEYIERLKKFEAVPFTEYNPTKEQTEAINQRVFTMEEIIKTTNEDSDAFLSVMKGVVFDLNKFPKTWKPKLNGKDVTLSWAARWAYANEENCKSVNALEDAQKLYINGEVQKWIAGAWNAKVVGKVDSATAPISATCGNTKVDELENINLENYSVCPCFNQALVQCEARFTGRWDGDNGYGVL